MASVHQVGKLACSLGRKNIKLCAGKKIGHRNVSRVATTAQSSESKVEPFSVAIASSLVAGGAHADDASAGVDSAVGVVVDLVKVAGGALKAGVGVVENAIDVGKQVYAQVEPGVKVAAETAAPIVKSATDIATPLVGAGIKATEQAVRAAGPTLERALSEVGVDTKAVVGIEKTAIEVGKDAIGISKPIVEQVVTFLTTSEPVVVAESALGVIAAFYLAGPLLSLLGGAIRGYAGDISPAAALDALFERGNTYLVDIRTEREKENAGLPDLPNNSKLIELEYASIEDRKVRGQLRNAGELELKVTAMQIAALKRLGKGSTIFLMDKNGSGAKAVARELAAKGFGKVCVLKGGFGGWQGAKLKVKPSSVVSRVEVILPGIGGTGTRTQTRQLPPTPRRLQLPSGR